MGNSGSDSGNDDNDDRPGTIADDPATWDPRSEIPSEARKRLWSEQ